MTTSAACNAVYTIGHSTRSLEEFLHLLRSHGVQLLVDVRRFPGSRRYPHFGGDALATSLASHNIDYIHEAELGGRRRPAGDSPNTYWRNAQFRAYADHLSSAEFQAALTRLIETSAQAVQCLMCAEAVPWRCHRQLIADALVARGIAVLHIMSSARADQHTLNEHAILQKDGALFYPASADPQLDLFRDQP